MNKKEQASRLKICNFNQKILLEVIDQQEKCGLTDQEVNRSLSEIMYGISMDMLRSQWEKD